MRRFLISDTHFGHANILNFIGSNGERVRDFESVEVMDEHMIFEWNAVVRENDIVYHLGDVVMNKKHLSIMKRLNGTKILILGNHDTAPIEDYLGYFKSVHGSLKVGKLICTHYPIHEGSITHWALGNVHGHVHTESLADKRYFNVSAEVLNYSPILVDQVEAYMEHYNVMN